MATSAVPTNFRAFMSMSQEAKDESTNFHCPQRTKFKPVFNHSLNRSIGPKRNGRPQTPILDVLNLLLPLAQFFEYLRKRNREAHGCTRFSLSIVQNKLYTHCRLA